MKSITQRIAQELEVNAVQVEAATGLIDDGATVPFVARYRKEATGGLDDSQLRTLEERLHYLRELEERRQTILKSVAEQEKLTPELETAILEADTKTRLEDLYLPYRPKRRTKAQIARAAGLEPLALGILTDPSTNPEQAAIAYTDDASGVNNGIADALAALEGAKQILMERFAEDPELATELREHLWETSALQAKVVDGKEHQGGKFADYFDYAEPIRAIPSHRALALFRGRNEGVLQLKLTLADADSGHEDAQNPALSRIAQRFCVSDRGRPGDAWLLGCVQWAWRVKLFPRLELDLMGRLREGAEEEAIRVFAANLKDLLLAAPAGQRRTIGLDPGLRTGVKVIVVDETGKILDSTTIYPHPPQKRWDESIAVLAALAHKHKAELLSIGNGTASRETDRLADVLIREYPALRLAKVMVSEAGASVYSASAYASEELPELDVSLRGAVSIARRLQDPLAELVKIEPKSIGVGQYQHDVAQSQLARSLDTVVEDCVNAVGVDVNTASEPLLARVSGLSRGLAHNIVAFRDGNGAFRERATLHQVPRLGAKTFEQAAGFLRIVNGTNPLDGSAVHPEAYPLVEKIARKNGRSVASMIGDRSFLSALAPRDYVDERFGLPTVTDVLAELEKPGRDPRPEFKTARFQEGIEKIGDLRPAMVLEGVITNVTNFGAFVDIGVHQDGLVHISALADRFVKDPREVVKTGDVVRVKVLEVDLERKRIALSMRLRDEAAATPSASPRERERRQPNKAAAARKDGARRNRGASNEGRGAMGSALAEALARAKKR